MFLRSMGWRIFWAAVLLRTLSAGQFLIVSRTPEGAWSFQQADTILVNGKDKLRGAPLGQSVSDSWDPKGIGKQPEARLADFTVVRRRADGALIGRTGSEWKLLLPEGLKTKAAEPSGQIWKQSAIGYREDRKEKAESPVRSEILYAIVPGADAGASAAALATDVSWHAIPGVTAADGFRQMVSLLPAAARSFTAAGPADTMRTFMNAGISSRLAAWREGDAEISVLEEAGALADAARAAFPMNANLTDLRNEVEARRKWINRRVAILRALDAGKQADAFLIAYREFEPFDRSFPALSQARVAHLNASAAAHLETGRELQKRGDYPGAIRHLLIAKWRNPKLAGVDDQLEQVRLQAARISSQSVAAARAALDPRSPQRVQLQRKLLMVEQYINDRKLDEAETALAEAAASDPEEPRLALLEAQLAIGRGELGRALALLDNYAGNAPTAQDLAEGEKLRASVLYSIDKERLKTSSDLSSAFEQQRFSTALGAAADGLKVDNESPQFLYQASVNTCILRNCARAVPLLHRYLEVTDSLQADRRQRIAAIRLLSEAEAQQSLAGPDSKGAQASAVSWFSGTSLGRGVFYDPVSLSFQLKVAHIEASEHVTVNYEWSGNKLLSVHTKHEEKKTAGNIARLMVAGAAASQGIGSTVGWRTPDRETNDFYFNYYDDMPQVLKVSRDNTMVRSRTIPISIPGIGGFGGLGMLGGLSGGLGLFKSFGATKGLSASAPGLPGMAGLGGMSGLPKMPGVTGMAGLPNLSSSSGGGILGRLGTLGGGMGGFNSFGAARQFIPSQQYSIHSDPDGNSTSGYLTLWNNPRLDTRLAWKVTGKRAAVGFSGNRFFHPFAWDAIHLFELDYDEQGRIVHAWELGDPKAPRIDFAWEGQRLLKVTAQDGAAVIYTRVLNYSGDRLSSEMISQPGGKTAHIEYKYDKQGRLLEADCDADTTLDGRSRKVHFQVDGKEQ